MINASHRILGIIVLILGFLAISNGLKAQNVVRQGKAFVELSDSSAKKSEPKKTEYVFIDKNGDKYDVYISSNDKAFIICTSKKTGKQYRRYLPTITKELTKK